MMWNFFKSENQLMTRTLLWNVNGRDRASFSLSLLKTRLWTRTSAVSIAGTNENTRAFVSFCFVRLWNAFNELINFSDDEFYVDFLQISKMTSHQLHTCKSLKLRKVCNSRDVVSKLSSVERNIVRKLLLMLVQKWAITSIVRHRREI